MKKRIIYAMGLAILLFGCSNSSDDGSGNDPNGGDQDQVIGVKLVFPQRDSLCNEGVNPTPTESTVFFEWLPNTNAETYSLTVENLNSGSVMQYQTEDFIFPVTIARAEAFRWSVSYNYEGESQESEVWNFYNEGLGEQTYPPFPAEIIAPGMAQNIPATNSVTLVWIGRDLDEDILSYDVYFGTNNPPSLVASDILEGEFTVDVVPDTVYYWNITTKDIISNTSESGIYQFKVSQ